MAGFPLVAESGPEPRRLRNTKRRLTSDSTVDDPTAVAAADVEGLSDGDQPSFQSQPTNAWTGPTFAAKLRQPVVKPPLYTGDDHLEDEEDLDLSNLVNPLKDIRWGPCHARYRFSIRGMSGALAALAQSTYS